MPTPEELARRNIDAKLNQCGWIDLKDVTESKRALRQRLTALPIADKLRLLDTLREQAIALRAATLRHTLTVQEKPPGYRA